MDSSQSSDAFSISRSALNRLLTAASIVGALVIVALIVALIARAVSPTDPIAGAINANDYQAVFLTNGQVYFGHLSTSASGAYELRHVYYLSSTKSGAKLNKLVNDVYGPKDLIIINRAQILYVENLRPDGRAARLMNAGGP